MDVLTIAAIAVGKATAKAILKFWLKDNSIGQNISSDLIDLVASKTSDTFAQRKGNRQFEEIGDKITESILPLFQSESTVLDEGERKAVAYAVAETLNQARLTRDILLHLNLQPADLEKYLLNSDLNVTDDLSASATALYHRVIHECCIYIVDISSQLPAFTEHTFAEILKREDLIIDRVNEVIDELHKISKFLDLTDQASRFEREYREAVARNLDVLQLIGADVSLPNRRHQLSVAYISLTALQHSTHLQTDLPIFTSG